MAPPVYKFQDPREFVRIHSAGAKVEFDYEKRKIDEFNRQANAFRAWCITSLGTGKKSGKNHWLFLVAPGDKVEWRLPREGEECKVKLVSKSGKITRSSWWDAERIDNPGSALGLPADEWHRYAAFKVDVKLKSDEASLVKPLIDAEDGAPTHANIGSLFNKKCKFINFQLSVTEKTMRAELGAVERLFDVEKHPDLSSAQRDAFMYLMAFRATSSVNLFDKIPHLARPVDNPFDLPRKVIAQYGTFNDHQKAAYRHLLRSLPCGIGILPGGPGAGKTHWNLVVCCLAQARPIEVKSDAGITTRGVKVLYLLDINKPLDDTANKMVKLYEDLGLKKRAVRLYSWNYRGSKGKADFTRKFLTQARLRRTVKGFAGQGCMAATLDELAYSHYLEHRTTKYQTLWYALAEVLKQGSARMTDEFRDCVREVYMDALDEVDFIATTPVPAAERFSELWKPDLVFFDESPHARELSTLIAIAHYEPLAWIFSGDHRQTRPFVATDDVRDNPFCPQMLVSTMERADKCGAIKHSLLINHRAYGGLERLASRMFYKSEMVPSTSTEKSFPPSATYMRTYLERLLGEGRKCQTSRLLVHFDDGAERNEGTSWHNPHHLEWVMERIKELCREPKFVRVGGKGGRGTILVISPYKEQYMQYRKAISKLPQDLGRKLDVESRVEARTIDTVQGHEADVVFLDFVRHRANNFTDDPNRLCVAITRARQAEIVLLQPGMKFTTDGRLSRYLQQIWEDCERQDQIVLVSSRGSSTGKLAAGQQQRAGGFLDDLPTIPLNVVRPAATDAAPTPRTPLPVQKKLGSTAMSPAPISKPLPNGSAQKAPVGDELADQIARERAAYLTAVGVNEDRWGSSSDEESSDDEPLVRSPTRSPEVLLPARGTAPAEEMRDTTLQNGEPAPVAPLPIRIRPLSPPRAVDGLPTGQDWW